MTKSVINKSIVLASEYGLKVILSQFGARILSIQYQNKEMLVFYKDMHAIYTDQYYLGATCGRVANRIANAQYTYQGNTVKLNANEGCNSLHGGAKNFSNQLWQVHEYNSQQCFVELTLHSPDGDQGFVGEVIAHVRYQLIADSLHMTMTAHTNKLTPIDLTNHCYFNLGEDHCLDLHLAVNTERYLIKDSNNVPMGEIKTLDNQQLLNNKPINAHLATWQQQKLIDEHGFDHYVVFNDVTADTPQATLSSSKNAIQMQLYTDQPGIQLYTGGHLGAPFAPFAGVCLEAQNYPNAVNIAHFPSPMISPCEIYQNHIKLAFSVT